MKKVIFAILISMIMGQYTFAHSAKKEVKKDDTMIKLGKDVRELILEKGDYDSALKLYALAARKNSSEPYYREQYSILRRVIKMKKAMVTEDKAVLTEPQKEKWTSYYLAVRAYYYAQGYYSESEELDKNANDILKTDQARINYLETLVVLNKAKEAQKVILETKGAIIEKADFKTLALLGESIENVSGNTIGDLEKIEIDPKQDVRSLVYSACIYQLNDDHNKACKSITMALENTAPTVISTTRKLIVNMKPLQECKESKKFQAALTTESKVYQSGCTGGSSCNSCSLKDTCSSNK